MRKPNWKRRGYNFAGEKLILQDRTFKLARRLAKLDKLPPELRAEIEKHPEILDTIP